MEGSATGSENGDRREMETLADTIVKVQLLKPKQFSEVLFKNRMVWRGRLGEVRPVAARCVMVWHVKEWNGRHGELGSGRLSSGRSRNGRRGKAWYGRARSGMVRHGRLGR